MSEKFRLITRSDFDGLVCAMLLKHLDIIEEIKFVHPKDMQDGIIAVGSNDITTNLPYVEGVYLAFDHHSSELIRNKDIKENYIIDSNAPSAARVVYNHYGGDSSFPKQWNEMMEAVDKADSAKFSVDDILKPKGWELLSFLMDARTGLGRFKTFKISNYDLMMELISYCTNHTIEEILELPNVKERVDLYFSHEDKFKEQIRKNSRIYGNVLVVDLLEESTIWAGNRFVKYAIFPETNISIQVMWGLNKQNTVLTVGKSIVNRSSEVDIGELMLKYNGGGHKNAGTCQIDNDKVYDVLIQLIEKCKE